MSWKQVEIGGSSFSKALLCLLGSRSFHPFVTGFCFFEKQVLLASKLGVPVQQVMISQVKLSERSKASCVVVLHTSKVYILYLYMESTITVEVIHCTKPQFISTNHVACTYSMYASNEYWY